MSEQKFKVNCGFFNSINHDKLYCSEDMNRPYKRLVGNGVFATQLGDPSTDLQVFTANNKMDIIVKKGEGIFNNKWFENPTDLIISVPKNNSIIPRIDSIIARVDMTRDCRDGSIVYIEGIENENPVKPEININEDVIEYRLANIYVAPNTNTILQENITDLRGSEECPWVTGLIKQVDTSTLFIQYKEWLKRVTGEAEINLEKLQEQFEKDLEEFMNSSSDDFNAWLETLQETLDGDTAGHLLNLINSKASKQEFDDFKNGLSKTYIGSSITAPTCGGFGRIHKLYGKTEEIGTGEKGPDNPYEIKCVADDINYFDKSKLSITHAWHCTYTITSDKEIEVQNTSTGIFTLDEESEIHFNFYIWPTSLKNTMTISDIQIKKESGSGYSEYSEGSIVITSTGKNDINNKLISIEPLCCLKNETGNIVAQDYIDFTRAKIHRECGYLRLDGSLNWELDKEVNGLTRFTLFAPDLNCISQNVNDMCSHFKYIADWDSSTEPRFYYYDSMVIVFVPQSIATTIDEFKTWLNNNDVTFIYKLKIPFEEDIDVVNDIIQYEGETTISNSDDATMEMELTKNKAVSSINENLSALQGMYFSNQKDIKEKDGTIYGVRRQIDNPLTSWERVEGAVGLVANATKDGSEVQNDFDNIYPWSDIISCDVAQDGTINSYYGDPGFSFTNPKGYIMTRFPEFYWKREQKDGYEYVYISASEHERFVKSEEFMLGRYIIAGSSSAITCKSDSLPLTNIGITDLRTCSKKIGNDWGLMDIWRWSMLQILYLVEYADYNSQDVLGYGCCSGSKINSGECDVLGMKSGCTSNDKAHAVIYRGVENVFGNISQWLDGISVKDYYSYVCKDKNLYVSEKVTPPYMKLGYQDATSVGYAKTVGYDFNNSSIQRVTTTGGSNNTYIPDYFNLDFGIFAICVGGAYNCSLNCGLWCWDYRGATDTKATDGGRLLFMKEDSEGGN